MMLTTSASLGKSLGAEVRGLRAHVQRVGEDTWRSEGRRVSWQARALVALGVEGML